MTITGQIEQPVPHVSPNVWQRSASNLVLWIWSVFSFRRVRPHQRRPAWPPLGPLLVGAVVTPAAIAGAMVFLDARTIGLHRNLPQWVVLTFETITDFGRSGWILIPAGVAVLLIAAISSPALGRIGQFVLAATAARLGFVFLAVGLPGLVVTIVKRLIGRARPYVLKTSGPFDFAPFNWNVEFASLPSGHGTTAFATAFALGALYPRLRLPLWAFAIAIGVSRVALAAHYPSDVLAGALTGILGALVVRNWFAVRRLAFVVAPDQSVQPLPGPSLRRLQRVLGRAWSR